MDEEMEQRIYDIHGDVQAMSQKIDAISSKLDRAYKEIGRNESEIENNREKIDYLDTQMTRYIAKASGIVGSIVFIGQIALNYVL